MSSNIRLIPYAPDHSHIKSTFLRLLVKPIARPDRITQSGLVIPGDISTFCEMGVVFATCDGSTFKEGDTILYKKMDRRSPELLDTVAIDGEVYDALFENEVWAVNYMPFNRIFVLDTPNGSLSDGGLILPDNASATSNGVVFRAPAHYSVKEGDAIEYRRPEQQIYPSIEIEGNRYICMSEADVFKVNGKVAPYKIIVKVDLAQQTIKRSTIHGSKLLGSELAAGMLRNLQVAEVVEVGTEAQKNFPDIHVGNQAILHHRVEHEPYRLLKREFAKADKNVATFEYRIVDAFDPNNRDLMGRIVSKKNGVFVPFGKNVFLEWGFEVLPMEPRVLAKGEAPLVVEFDNDIAKCTDIEALKMAVRHKLEGGFKKADGKRRSILKSLSECVLPQDDDRYRRLEIELRIAEGDCRKIQAHDGPNFLVMCKRRGSTERVICGYKELYPINIFGRRFLIGYEDYVLAETSFGASATVSD